MNRWANPEKIGIIIKTEDHLRYIDNGPEYEEALGGIIGLYLGPDVDVPSPPAVILAAERLTMVCTPLQGRLVLGEATCSAIDAMAANPLTPWAMRQTIRNAIEWKRNSQSITELGYLLGYTDAQMDDLFRVAMTVEV